MNIRLKSHSRSFATRERARQLVADAGPITGYVELDLEGINASPSFLAQLLGDLSVAAESIVVVGADEHHSGLVTSLIEKLDLGQKVRVAELA